MPQAKRTLNIAMIGHGFIARANSNAFNQVGRLFDVPFTVSPKVVCGRDRSRLEAFAIQWVWADTAPEWQMVVGRRDVDVVDIAVPNALHAPIAIEAAKAGKIVLCEKPLAVSVAEAEQLVAAVDLLPNLVWFNYRRVPAI